MVNRALHTSCKDVIRRLQYLDNLLRFFFGSMLSKGRWWLPAAGGTMVVDIDIKRCFADIFVFKIRDKFNNQ